MNADMLAAKSKPLSCVDATNSPKNYNFCIPPLVQTLSVPVDCMYRKSGILLEWLWIRIIFAF